MDSPTVSTPPAPETSGMTDAERRKRLLRLSERMLSEDGLDHETLEHIEQLVDDEQ